jgi:hypothetical protein
MASEMASETKSGRMADYAVAVDRAAAQLNELEQSDLRQSGTLPGWFFAAVEDERKAVRRRQQR